MQYLLAYDIIIFILLYDLSLFVYATGCVILIYLLQCLALEQFFEQLRIYFKNKTRMETTKKRI